MNKIYIVSLLLIVSPNFSLSVEPNSESNQQPDNSSKPKINKKRVEGDPTQAVREVIKFILQNKNLGAMDAQTLEVEAKLIAQRVSLNVDEIKGIIAMTTLIAPELIHNIKDMLTDESLKEIVGDLDDIIEQTAEGKTAAEIHEKIAKKSENPIKFNEDIIDRIQKRIRLTATNDKAKQREEWMRETLLHKNSGSKHLPLFVKKHNELDKDETLSAEKKYQIEKEYITSINDEDERLEETEKLIKQAFDKIVNNSSNPIKMVEKLQELQNAGITNKKEQIKKLEEYEKEVSVEKYTKQIHIPKETLSSLIGKPPHEMMVLIDKNQHPEEFEIKRPEGILFYGKPGTGKTITIKAIAGETKTPLLIWKQGDVKSKWYGETEKEVRAFFTAFKLCIAKYGRCYAYFDEINTLATSRKNNDSKFDADLQETILIEMNDLPPGGTVVGSTNSKETLDPAMLRPGRFGTHIEFKLPDDKERALFIKELDKKWLSKRPHKLNKESLISKTDGFSQAELEGLYHRVSDESNYHRRAPMDGDFDKIIDVIKRERHEAVLAEKRKRNGLQ